MFLKDDDTQFMSIVLHSYITFSQKIMIPETGMKNVKKIFFNAQLSIINYHFSIINHQSSYFLLNSCFFLFSFFLFLFLITYYLLFFTYYFLLSALCPLPSALCPLPSALCPLPSNNRPRIIVNVSSPRTLFFARRFCGRFNRRVTLKMMT